MNSASFFATLSLSSKFPHPQLDIDRPPLNFSKFVFLCYIWREFWRSYAQLKAPKFLIYKKFQIHRQQQMLCLHKLEQKQACIGTKSFLVIAVSSVITPLSLYCDTRFDIYFPVFTKNVINALILITFFLVSGKLENRLLDRRSSLVTRMQPGVFH